LGKFLKVLQGKMLVFLLPFCLHILRPNGTFCGHLVHFVVIWYIFPSFGTLYREKSGNPGRYYCDFTYVCTRTPQANSTENKFDEILGIESQFSAQCHFPENTGWGKTL
jgi:hypothetical protein